MDLNRFGEELETRAMAVERERTSPEFYSQKFLGLLIGDGNQSGINDPQPSNSNG